MTKESATLIAAIIAAVSSFLSVILNLKAQRGAEMRAAHRKAIESYLEELSETIHSTLATADIYLKRVRRGQSVDNWRQRASETKQKLEVLRRKVRYPLWGIDNGLRALTRLANWVSHAQKVPDRASEILDAAETLRKAIDKVIVRSYQIGRPPTKFDSIAIDIRAWQLRRKYKEIMKIPINNENSDD